MGDTHHLLLSDIYVIPPPDISTQLSSHYKIFKLNRESEELGHLKSIVLLLSVDTIAMFVLLLLLASCSICQTRHFGHN